MNNEPVVQPLPHDPKPDWMPEHEYRFQTTCVPRWRHPRTQLGWHRQWKADIEARLDPMTAEELGNILEKMMRIYGLPINEDALKRAEIYVEMLIKFPACHIRECTENWIKEREKFPMLSEIREAIVYKTNNDYNALKNHDDDIARLTALLIENEGHA